MDDVSVREPRQSLTVYRREVARGKRSDRPMADIVDEVRADSV